MEVPSPSDPTAVLVPSELRRRVESTCADVRVERARSVAADAALREARHAAERAHAQLEVAVATLDQRRLAEHKDEARRSYRLALSTAKGPPERQLAATTWLRRIDDLNRSSRGAIGLVLMLRAQCETLDQALRDASMVSSAQRVRTESAEASCVQARRDLAEQDRWAAEQAASVVIPVNWAGTGVSLRGSDQSNQALTFADGSSDGSPALDADALAIERVLAGDAAVTRELARQMADLTGSHSSRCLLLLQVLSEAIVSSAIEHGHLRFDRTNPLWANMSADEARSVTKALRDLGFRYDVGDGWYGERAPQSRDLALALAYAGIETHAMRRLLTNEELARLPETISVAPLEHLAAMAPDLGLDDVHQLAGGSAQELADLWDHWADVRALLLGPAPVAVEA
jgi:hypothetical protein